MFHGKSRDWTLPYGTEGVGTFAEVLRSARQSWPGVELDDATFREYLAARTQSCAPEALGGLHGDSLYLTCACARGDSNAIRIFEAHHFGAIAAVHQRMRIHNPDLNETKQLVREKLFVAAGKNPPGIQASSNTAASAA